ncbi:peptide/nickel transport system substrate-binding protein [Streptomyces zhaozhouensis]|uniref:Peptide/nickel transport system substrate-binding protein n=1 Tax=Streptomyces zhaozhouensis TaxID=1300267 RepID=A0A286DT59_9ACTN|nr:ABC transporter substrate-binding protein [Streptomyces zhaozhouensis]SOD61849.1 peptide/nickel transport system substrate-binding protein [Streptomyces zhaozhouensis]
MTYPSGRRSGRSFGRSLDRRAFLRYGGALGAAGALTAGLGACGPPSTIGTGGGHSGGALNSLTAVIGYGNDQSWDPTQTASAFSMAANHHIYEGLLDTDPISRVPYPALATALPADPTATTWSFTLRPGATWHDGEPVTVEDVLFTFERVLDPEVNTLARSFFASWLEGVRAVDEATVELDFRFPFPDAAPRLTIAKIMPRHVFGEEGAWDRATGGLAVGSGPYRQSAHHPKSNTTFEAFEEYNGPRHPAFRTMNWRSVVEAAPRVAAVSGNSAEAQIAENIPYANVRQLRDEGLQVEGGAGMNHLFMMFNTENPPFDDVRVRQALLHAIDTEQLIEVGLKGYGRPATSFLDTANPAHRPAATVYSYDPDRARQLLDEAGVTDLSINLMAVNVSWAVDCLPTIKESWDAIGVPTTLEPQETSALFTKMDQDRAYQAVAAVSNPNQFGLDADLILRYNYTRGGLWMSYTGWEGSEAADELFALMDRATEESDPERRLELTHQALDLVAEQAVLYPVVHNELLTAWDPRAITGVRAQAYPGINVLQTGAVTS